MPRRELFFKNTEGEDFTVFLCVLADIKELGKR
jgi:hypothetical protein